MCHVKKDPEGEKNSRDPHIKNHYHYALCNSFFFTRGQKAAGPRSFFYTWLCMTVNSSISCCLKPLRPLTSSHRSVFLGPNPETYRYDSEHGKRKHRVVHSLIIFLLNSQYPVYRAVLPDAPNTVNFQDAFRTLPNDFPQKLYENINESKGGLRPRHCSTYCIFHIIF